MHNQIDIQLLGGKLDLNENAEREFFVTKAIHKLQDIETRDSETSKELVIPRTPNNIRLLGRELPSFRGDFSGASSALFCEVLMFDITIINDALLFVLSESLSENTITIGIFGGSQKFFNQVSTDSIRELNFAEFNIEWTATNLAAITQTVEGLLYGKNIWQDNESIQRFLIEKDGINDIDLTYSEVEASAAWFFVKTIFKKILENTTGLTFDNAFLDSPFFDDMVMSLPITQLLEDWQNLGDSMRGLVSPEEPNSYSSGQVHKLEFEIVRYEAPIGFWDLAENEFVITTAGLVTIDFRFLSLLVSSASPENNQASVYLMVNGVIIKDYTFPYGVVGVSPEHRAIVETTFNAVVGDRIYIRYVAPNVVFGGGYTKFDQEETTFNVRLSGGKSGNYVVISDYLPDITQKDFVKEVFKLGHIIPIEVNNNIIFYPWEAIYNQPSFDLTQYLDTSQPIIKQSLIQGYGKKNHFQYTGSNAVKRVDTDTEIPQDNAILPENVTKIQSKFIPCDDTELNESGFAVSPVFGFEYEHVDENKITIAVNTNTFSTTERHGLNPGDHIFVWDDQTLETMKRKVIDIVDDFSGVVDTDWTTNHDEFDWDFIKYTATPIALQIAHARGTELMTISDGGEIIEDITTRTIIFTDSLRWDEIIKEYYYNFRATVYRPLVFTAWFNIPLIIFKQMSFGTSVYIGGVEAAKFYVNNAEQYKIDTSVRMELIKLESFVVMEIRGEFTVVPEEPVNLGNWSEGDPLPEQIYTITNTGTIELNITIALGGDQSQFYEVVTSTPIVIPPGENRPATIRFLGSEHSGGNNAEINFNDANSLTRTRLITTNVQVYSYTVVPTGTANLGDWNVGDDPLSQLYTVTNDGDQPLSVAFNVTGDGYTTPTASPLVLLPSESAPITVEFDGDALIAGVKAGVLNLIESSAGNQTRNLTANVVAFPVMTIEPVADVNMGDWGTGDPPLTQAYTWFNSGNVAIDVNASLIQDASNFVLTGGSPDFTVLPSSGNIRTVEFNGSIEGGEHNCILSSILTHIPGSVERNLTANVEAIRTFTVEPTGAVDFGDWSEGQALPSQDYLITNLGNIDLNFENEMRGADLEYYEVNLLAITVPRGENRTISASFVNAGVVEGIKQGILNVIESISRDTEAREITTNIVIPNFEFTVEPVGNVDLGDWESGDAALIQAYLITNTGNMPLSVGMSVLGGNPSEWTISGGVLPVEIPVGGNATRNVNFVGVGDIGNRGTSIVFSESNAGNQSRELSARYARFPDLDFQQSWDLGAWTGSKLTASMSVQNLTGAEIQIRTVNKQFPSYYLVTTNWRTVGSTLSTTFNIDFQGGTVGAHPDVILIEVEGYTPLEVDITASVAVAIPVKIGVTPDEDADLGDWVGSDRGKTYTVRNESVIETGGRFLVSGVGYFPSREILEPAPGGQSAVQIWFDGSGLPPGTYIGEFEFEFPTSPDVWRFAAVCIIP